MWKQLILIGIIFVFMVMCPLYQLFAELLAKNTCTGKGELDVALSVFHMSIRSTYSLLYVINAISFFRYFVAS